MVKKVTLDTLDIDETIVSPKDKVKEVEKQSSEPLPKPFSARWVYLFAVIVVIALGIAGLFLLRGTTKKSVVHHEPVRKKIVTSPTVPAKVNVTVLNDFLITVRDDRGMERIMLCDLSFELSDNQYNGFMNNVSEVRNIVYLAFKDKSLPAIMKPDGKSILKKEINAALVSLLGKDVVKGIYFTKFVVL